MSLATRCSSCGTAFRVVQDQLKVSEGWVRCGRCNAVFNALEGLFDLGRDVPSGWSEHQDEVGAETSAAEESGATASSSDDDRSSDFEKTLRFPAAAAGAGSAVETNAKAAPRAPAARAEVHGDVHEQAQAQAEDDSDDDSGSRSADDAATTDLGELLADPIDARLFGPRKRAEAAPKPAVELDGRDRVEFSDARFDSDLFGDNEAEPESDLVVLPTTDAGALTLESAARPDFVRRAERRARWRSGPARAALCVAVLLAAGALVLQIAHHERDAIAARWPSLRGPLVAWCRLAQCRIEAPRRIEDVVLETSALTRSPVADAFVLSLTLRSRSDTPLLTPSLDLALTDPTGRLIARRVLAPRDFNAAEVLPARTESEFQVLLTAGSAPVVGYTVAIFYP
jgi:predicted Zn finger-like uncharacterized protein